MKINIEVSAKNVKIWRVVFEIIQAVLNYFKDAHNDGAELDDSSGSPALPGDTETFKNGVNVLISTVNE